MSGKLYICGTPIGNLSDITLRVIETLKNADIIACEDTRHTLKLLNHYEIKAKLTSYHEHNKISKGQVLIEQLTEGKNIALVTDAGMPGISDPGADLIHLCIENNIEVTCCPGVTAQVTALVLSGLDTRRYVFEGFLPRDKKERKEVLELLKNEYRTIVLYEAPHHLKETLQCLRENLGCRKAAAIRELTKKHEEVLRGDLDGLLAHFKEKEPLGEFVIVISGADKAADDNEKRNKWLELSIEDHMAIYTQNGIDKKEAMKKVAKDRGLTKRDIYAALLE